MIKHSPVHRGAAARGGSGLSSGVVLASRLPGEVPRRARLLGLRLRAGRAFACCAGCRCALVWRRRDLSAADPTGRGRLQPLAAIHARAYVRQQPTERVPGKGPSTSMLLSVPLGPGPPSKSKSRKSSFPALLPLSLHAWTGSMPLIPAHEGPSS